MKVMLANDQSQKMLDYLELMNDWNRTHNLTSLSKMDEMIDLHLLDSISAHKHLLGEHIADAGSGAGLPGIVLAILSPEKRFSLIDTRRKRCSFLRLVSAQLELDNVSIIQGQAEDHVGLIKADTMISRALCDFSELLDRFLHLFNHPCRLIGLCSEKDTWKEKLTDDLKHQVLCFKPDLPRLDHHRLLIFDIQSKST